MSAYNYNARTVLKVAGSLCACCTTKLSRTHSSSVSIQITVYGRIHKMQSVGGSRALLSRLRAGAQATQTEQLNCTYGCVRRSRFGATLSNDAAARDKVVVCSLLPLTLTRNCCKYSYSITTLRSILYIRSSSIFFSLYLYFLFFSSLLFSAMYDICFSFLLSPSILCYCIYFSFLFFSLFTLSTCEHRATCMSTSSVTWRV